MFLLALCDAELTKQLYKVYYRQEKKRSRTDILSSELNLYWSNEINDQWDSVCDSLYEALTQREFNDKPTKHLWHQKDNFCLSLFTLVMLIDLKLTASDMIHNHCWRQFIHEWIDVANAELKNVLLKQVTNVEIRVCMLAFQKKFDGNITNAHMKSSVKMTVGQSDLSDWMFYCNVWDCSAMCASLLKCEIMSKSSDTTAHIKSIEYVIRKKIYIFAFQYSFYTDRMKLTTASTWLDWPLLWDSTAALRQTRLTWWRRWWWSLRRKTENVLS